MKVVSVCAGILFPYAAQAVQVVRRRRTRSGNWHVETAYATTSLAAHQAGPADLADAVHGHWTVENRLHWIRDVVFDEDRAQVRTGNGPRVMASLRNLAIIALRLTGVTNVAAALGTSVEQTVRLKIDSRRGPACPILSPTPPCSRSSSPPCRLCPGCWRLSGPRSTHIRLILVMITSV